VLATQRDPEAGPGRGGDQLLVCAVKTSDGDAPRPKNKVSNVVERLTGAGRGVPSTAEPEARLRRLLL
jgi:hypothetical protein